MSVAQLKEYDDRYRSNEPPTYSYTKSASGIGFKATCNYRNLRTEGSGSSKKDAQRQAAQQMLQLLNVQPKVFPPAPAVTASSQSWSGVAAAAAATAPARARDLQVLEMTDDRKERAIRFLAAYCDTDPHSDVRKSMKSDQYIVSEDDVDMGLKGDGAPTSGTLLSLPKEIEVCRAVDLFITIMKEMKLKFSCKVPETKHEGNHIVLLLIHHKSLMAGGTGASVEVATYYACQNAIMMLQIYVN